GNGGAGAIAAEDGHNLLGIDQAVGGGAGGTAVAGAVGQHGGEGLAVEEAALVVDIGDGQVAGVDHAGREAGNGAGHVGQEADLDVVGQSRRGERQGGGGDRQGQGFLDLQHRRPSV